MATLKQQYKAEGQALRNAVHRCHNPNHKAYPNYGARGITVCDEWRDFTGAGFIQFLKDMGPKPNTNLTLERKDNDKGYSPDNCIWGSRSQQARNRRPWIKVTQCRNDLITYNGQTMILTEWAAKLKLKTACLWARIHEYKLPLADALTPGRLMRKR